jgi:NADH-quinone oxidoreductase subunit N
MSFQSAGYQLLPVLPELVLAAGAMVLLMIGAYNGQRATGLVTALAVGLLIVVGGLELMLPAGKLTTFNGSFIVDDFARFLKILAMIGSAATLILSAEFLSDPSRRIFEYAILVLLSTLGMMILISAGDLIMLYLGLELMSLALYVVAASNRDNAKSTEAGLKYFVLGALSSGMLLYGASLVYGFTGTVSFAGIAAEVKTGSIGIVFGLVFLLAGLCFKVSAVPFHMWTPDVYEGAPTPVTAFFASAPKVAALAVFTRVTLTAFPGIVPQWQQIVVFVSIASMALGSFAAIGQTSIKRLMAYSSIGHMGFALVGLAAGTTEGAQGVLVYIAIYVAMTLGSFSVILAMKRNGQHVENISDFSGLWQTNPILAFFFAMLLFSLAGIPPLAGFFAKFYVFLAAINAGLFTLSVIGVLSSVVGAFYYLTVIKVMFFDPPLAKLDPMRGELRLVLAVAGLFNLFFVVYPGLLVSAATVAAKSLF